MRVAGLGAATDPPSDLERLRVLVDGVKDFAIFMLDTDGRVATWSLGAERLKGYRAEEILGADVSRFFTPEDTAAGKPRHALEVAGREGRHEEETWRVRKDGSRFWADVVTTALRDPAGTLLGYGKVTRDITDRLRATDQFRLAIEAAPTGMIMMNDRGRIVLVNAQVERLFGYTREEVVGQSIEMLVPERFRARHPEVRATFFSDPRVRPAGAGRDLLGLRRDGTEIPIEIGLNPLETPDGQFVLASVVDIAERKRGEEERNRLLGQLRTLNVELEERVQARTAELQAALKEREVLLQEVHHRVKNNLQVISSLISIQVRSLGEEGSRHGLEECQTRVQAIALIHEQLYRSKDYARVPFAEYSRSLVGNVFRATEGSPERIRLEFAVEDVALGVDQAIPCGLILNELITNALRHAFPDGRSGTIRVELGYVAEGAFRLAVRDDGVGLPPGVEVGTAPSLGLQLVSMLAEQLNAALEVDRDHGTRVRLTVPVKA